jgi:ABC-type multidrug transport system fused ATPase/permease subunit
MDNWFTYLRNGLSREMPADRIAGKVGYGDIRRNLKNLRPFVSSHIRQGILGAVLVLICTLLTFPPPMIIRFITDRVILDKNLGLLAGGIGLLIVVKLAGKGLTVLQDFYFARFEQNILLDLQQGLLDHTLRLPMSFFDEKETGYLMTRITSDVQHLRWFFSTTIVYILSETISFIGGVIFLFYLEWRLALVMILPIPVLIWGMGFFTSKTRILDHHGMEEQARVNQQLQESITTSPLIKAFATEQRTVDQLTGQLKRLWQVSLEQVTVDSAADFLIGVMPWVANVAVLAVGAYLVIQDRWTLGSLLAFQGYISFVYNPAEFLASANLQMQNALAALERISALFDIVPEESGTGELVQKLQGDVTFSDVSFAYQPEEPVLRQISFAVQAGEKVAIVGQSGVGKTTLVSLLMRLYQPQSGTIRFDGLPVEDYELHSLRERIGFVSQRTQLIAGTIRENLRYGSGDASDHELVQACLAAGIDGYIQSLPGKYDTLLQEGGSNLSEGQRQRLSLARVLIKNPDVVILDEPTSALDATTEKNIFENLPELLKSKTVFIVAHRLATIQQADRILLIEDGRLTGDGNHSQLLETCSAYRRLVDNQQVVFPQGED